VKPSEEAEKKYQEPFPSTEEKVPDTFSPADERLGSRLGLWLFAIYSLIYAGFVLLSAFAPRLIAGVHLHGVNLAVLYGMGLIIGAVALALAYAALCRLLAIRRRSRSAPR
jgi:hypothetical protein